MYGQRKPLASRSPIPAKASLQEADADSNLTVPNLAVPDTPRPGVAILATPRPRFSSLSSITDGSTPAATDGETGTESELTETDHLTSDADGEFDAVGPRRAVKIVKTKPLMTRSRESNSPPRRKLRPLSQHDLLNRYFRKDVLILRNIDLLR
jgi:phosphatidylethanolamine N-methyltransferase